MSNLILWYYKTFITIDGAQLVNMLRCYVYLGTSLLLVKRCNMYNNFTLYFYLHDISRVCLVHMFLSLFYVSLGLIYSECDIEIEAYGNLSLFFIC